jgi:hypothetical protein
MKTIYNVAVLMDSQEQCDRMKQLCLDNGLPIWEDFKFILKKDDEPYRYFFCWQNLFCNYQNLTDGLKLITESEFIELLKQEKA